MYKALKISIQAVDKASAPLKALGKTVGGLEHSKKKLSATLAKTQGIQKLTAAGERLKTTLAKDSDALKKLQARLSEQGKLTVAQTARMGVLTEKTRAHRKALLSNRQELRKSKNALRATGVATRNLADTQARLKERLAHVNIGLKRLDKNANRLKRLQNLRLKLFAGGGLALGGLTFGLTRAFKALKGFADGADAVLKVSQRLGVTTTELQAYRNAATLAGASNADLDKSLEGMSKRLGELRANTGSHTLLNKSDRAFLAQLQGAETNAAAFEMLADKIASLKTPQEQAALANAALGRQGAKMLLLLRQGARGLAEARREIAALGGGITEADAKQAAKFNDALQRIKVVIDALKSRLATPIMARLTERMEGFLASIKGPNGAAVVQDLIDKLSGTARAVGALMDGALRAAPVIVRGFGKLDRFAATLAPVFSIDAHPLAQ